MAANTGVSNRCLKKRGRWKSDSSKDGYIVDSTEKPFEYFTDLRSFEQSPPSFVVFPITFDGLSEN